MKQFFEKTKETILNIWEKGIVQKTSRITYDVSANLLLFFIVVISMVVLFAGGAGAGYFASLVKDEPLRSYESMRKDIYNYEETSKLYFADNKYIGDIRSDLHREEIELKDVSENVINAVIATEDQLFYEHNGIVPKAIVRALYQDIASSGVQTGGSTLTQQLIKNQILTNEVSFERKAKEILLAMRLENFFEKDEILEAYLNIIPYGRNSSGSNIAGIQTAAQGVFGVDASELTVPQAAFLSGLPQNPYAYTPFYTSGEVKEKELLQLGLDRMQTVLKRMYQNDFISEEEYATASRYNIVDDFVERKETPLEKYPSVVYELERRAGKIIMEILANEDGYIMDDLDDDNDLKEQYEILAERALRMNGYNIHSTIDKKLYDTMQKTASKFEHYGPDKTVMTKNDDGKEIQEQQQVEVAASLIENETGRVLSFIGGREDTMDNHFNYATRAERSPGSTIKPLLVYGPGFELGKFQPGSVVADIPLGISSDSGKQWPTNVTNRYEGIVSVRDALTHSHNVSTVSLYREIVKENPAKNYLEKMGYPLTAERQEILALATGSTEVTVEQNTSAFSTLGNGGKYVEPYWIERITTADGTVIYEHESESVEIFSPQTTYLTVDIMRDVISQGTAAYLKPLLNNQGVDWAGKTGTSDDVHDLWFVGTNPTVTLGTWMGYKDPSSVECKSCSYSYSQRRLLLWSSIINDIAEINPDLITPSERFKQPDGIVNRSYCAVSGMLPSKICKEAGLIASDIFNSKFVPTEEDDSLVGGDMPLVMVDGESMVAGPDTPEEFTIEGEEGGIAFNPDFIKRMEYDKLDDLSKLFPRKNRELWEKIGFDGVSLKKDEDEEKKQVGKPTEPKKLKVDEFDLTWNYKKGEMIVGYRLYYAPKSGGKFQLLDHTIEPSYTLPEAEGVYHIRAVNYYGEESEPSSSVNIEIEEEEPEDEEKEDDEQDDSSSSNNNNQSNDNNGNDEVNNNNSNNNNENNNSNKNKNNNNNNG